MQGMSERQYAAHVGLSRGAIQKAKTAERLVLYPDGSINAAASDARREQTTDTSKTRKPPEPKLKRVGAIGDFAFQAANGLISGVEAMLNGVVTRINNFINGLKNLDVVLAPAA